MDSRLILKLDASVIEHARNYAKNKNTSLSKLIESYLRKLVEINDLSEVTPLVKSLSGVIDLPKNFNHKKEYKKHIVHKYKK